MSARSGGVAIVIGGAQNVWAELDMAQELCRDNDIMPRYFVANDMIEHFSKECVAVTLHADKLPAWLANRAIKGMIPPNAVWVCTSERKKGGAILSTNYMDDWGGSSGLFMIRIAISHYGLKVILCGVPLTVEGKHFVRNKPWNDMGTFVHRWNAHIEYLRKDVRSWSGKTREWFGVPTADFVKQEQSHD